MPSIKKLSWLLPGLWLAFLPRPAQSADFVLNIHYQVSCSNQTAGFPGLNAVLRYGDQTIRADFWKYETEKQILLSTAFASDSKIELSALKFEWDENSNCHLDAFKPEWLDLNSFSPQRLLALRYAPSFSVRGDQMSQRQIDLPLALTYTFSNLGNGSQRLRYTLYLSNEASRGFLATSKQSSLLHYGRRTDIEWIYDLELNADGSVVNERYQGGIISGFGHSTRSFVKSESKSDSHRMLYNIAMHNVFSDRGVLRDVYRMVPSEEISSENARETWMFEHPWSFEVSDRELAKLGLLSGPSEDYLYVMLKANGPSVKARIAIQVQETSLQVFRFKRLQNSLGGFSGFSAIRLTSFDQAKGGKLMFQQGKNNDRLETPRFYRLIKSESGELIATEVTSQFSCDPKLNCRF